MKTIGAILVVMVLVVGLGVVGTAMNLITIPWLKFNRQVEMNRNIVNKTYDADNALQTYHWFKEQAGQITALEQTITQSEAAQTDFEASAGARKDWTFEDKTEDNRLRQVVLGQKAQYNSLVQEYNAKASETDKAVFKDELPLFFNLMPY